MSQVKRLPKRNEIPDELNGSWKIFIPVRKNGKRIISGSEALPKTKRSKEPWAGPLRIS